MMLKSMRKPVSLMLMVLLALVMAVPAFAATKSYQFDYDGAYNSHASSYISGTADVTGTTVTIKLTGNYFPYLNADNGSGTFVTYTGSYNASTNLTTFVFSNSSPTSDIDVELYVSTVYHSELYPLTIHWL